MANKERKTVRAGRRVERRMSELHDLRRSIRGQVEREKALAAEVVEAAGDADALEGHSFSATLARCEGNVCWKDVAAALVEMYDVPALTLKILVETHHGRPYVRLTVTELEDGE